MSGNSLSKAEVLKILKSYRNIPYCIEAKNMELSRLVKQKNMMYELKLSQSSEAKDRLTAVTLKNIEDIKSRYERDMERMIAEINYLMEKKESIEKNIAKLDEKEERVLWLRYIEMKSWWQIEKIMHYAQRQPYNIHNKAVANLVKLWE